MCTELKFENVPTSQQNALAGCQDTFGMASDPVISSRLRFVHLRSSSAFVTSHESRSPHHPESHPPNVSLRGTVSVHILSVHELPISHEHHNPILYHQRARLSISCIHSSVIVPRTETGKSSVGHGFPVDSKLECTSVGRPTLGSNRRPPNIAYMINY